MKSISSLSFFALAGIASAQNIIDIAVGGSTGTDLFFFNPSNVTANVNDTVRFTFSGQPGNHSVTQSSFTDPCDPLGNGFDSGNILIPMGTSSGFPTWNLTITNASEPIWFFCKQLIPSPHCDVGMVGAINAPASGSFTFDAFMQAAMSHQGNSGQSVGFLEGQGASASAVPGPLTGSITGFGLPDATSTPPATVASPTTTGASAGSSSGAAPINAPGLMTFFLTTLLGVVFA